VAVDLARVVSWFPLILGRALGGSWLAAAQRRDALAEALILLSEGKQRRKLATWLVKASPQHRLAILGRMLLYPASLGFAARETASLPNSDSAENLIGAAIGVAAISVAAARNWQAERATALVVA
jgi:hypothetical protein